MPRRLVRRQSSSSEYEESTESDSSEYESEPKRVRTAPTKRRDSKRVAVDTATDSSSSDDEEPENPSQETYAPLRVGSIAGVPMRDGDDGIVSLCLALVIAAPTGSLPGTGLLLETKTDLEAEGCIDERVKRRKGLWLTNTHVSLETAYAMCAGITAMVLGEHFISGLYWETDHGDHSTRDVSEISPQFREYVDAVRADGLGGAVPESCRAKLDAALQRGAPKTKGQMRSLFKLLSRNEPEPVPYMVEGVCIACGTVKQCSHRLGDFPLGSDCARVLTAAKPVCDFVRDLQRRTQLPYPHDFQQRLEDALG